MTNPALLRSKLKGPVLVWEAASGGEREGLSPEPWTTTGAILTATRPKAGEPVVYEIKKGSKNPNTFPLGVTIGRTEHNDILLDDASVSRFHGYLQRQPETNGWCLVDANSSNGTALGGLKLSPNDPKPIPDRAKLRFGSVELQYLEPDSFLAYLEELSRR